jgi:hypothetical protein
VYLIFLHLLEREEGERREILLALAMELFANAQHQLVRSPVPVVDWSL